MSKTAQLIAFANFKGGTGKTTTCINVSGSLAKHRNSSKILVVDFDPQANATSGLGIDDKTLEYSIYDSVLDQCKGYAGVPITQIIVETEVENIHLAPSELDLSAAPMVMQQTKDRVGILNRILEPVKGFYDYILIDVPSDSGLFMLNTLRAAQHIVVPLDSSVFALEALEKLLTFSQEVEEMSGHATDKFTIVLNQYKKSRSSTRKTANPSPSEEIEAQLQTMGYQVFTVPESILVYRSQQAGMPISHYEPNSKIAKAYERIANSLI